MYKGIIYVGQNVKKWNSEWVNGKTVDCELKNSKAIDNFSQLFYLVSCHFGWDIDFDLSHPTKEFDVIIAHGMPSRKITSNRISLWKSIIDLPKTTKVICITTDIHTYNNFDWDNLLTVEDDVKAWFRKCIERSDVTLTSAANALRKLYPEYKDKILWFPNFFAPTERYTKLNFNENPTMKCLFNGSCGNAYPLRFHIDNNMDRFGHLIVRERAFFDNYAKLLNKYFCCIGGKPFFDMVNHKVFEITAAGSLLLTDKSRDLTLLGFKPDVHYVEVDEKNVFDKIIEVLNNPTKYNNIRKNGMKYSRENFSIDKAFSRIIKIIEGVCDGNNAWGLF
jgi:hypothetical protein